MIFLDTSGIYALADRDDANHDEAVRLFRMALESGETMIIHNYILVESAALLQRRLGPEIMLAFLDEAKSFKRVWIDEDLHEQAVGYLRKKSISRLSLVDALSFIIMERADISHFIGFDRHFEDAGFSRYTR